MPERAMTASSTLCPSAKISAFTSSSVFAFLATAASSIACVSLMWSALLATKSVSHLSAMMAAKPLSYFTSTQPFDASRSERLAAMACPFSRMISIALLMSPSASASAFLQSARPAPVILRSFCISAILTAIFVSF